MEIKREPPKVCPRTAKRCQIEQLYTLVEVEVVVDQRVDEMVEKLKDKPLSVSPASSHSCTAQWAKS